jgi:hypothetical protein
MRALTIGSIAVACLGLTVGTALLMARQQSRPGEIGENRVVVDNHRPEQAVPVVVQRIDQTTAVGVRAVRQTWEYRTVTFPGGKDAAGFLASAGLEGWEAVGFQPGQGMASVLLKRPR